MDDISYPESELQNESTMVLMVEHQESKLNTKQIDLRMFIIYDITRSCYVIFGRRFSGYPVDPRAPPFSFTFDSKSDTFDFIRRTIGYKELARITLYNYNNLCGLDTKDYSFELFEEYMDRLYEIAGYDNMGLTSKMACNTIRDFLRLMRNYGHLE